MPASLEPQVWSFESSGGLKPQVWSFEMEVIPKIEGNNAFKKHLIRNIPKIERKYFKGNLLIIPLKKTLLIIPFKVHNIPHSEHRCPI